MSKQNPKPAKSKKIPLKISVFATFWVMLVTCTCFGVSSQLGKYYDYSVQEAEFNDKYEMEALRQQDLIKSKDYYTSDAFIEKTAREQLGLIMPDEILFYNDAGN